MYNTAVLIFGTFNPVTNAHIEMGHIVNKALKNVDIYYVPTKDSFISDWKNYDNSKIITSTQRLDFLKNSLEPFGFFVSDVEIREIVDGKTYNTINYFKSLGYKEVYMVCGTDKIEELEKWYKAKELLNENKFLVIDRDNISLDDCMTDFVSKYKQNFISIPNTSKFNDVSSTKIRKAFEENDFSYIKENVPECVYNFYFERKAYDKIRCDQDER